MKHDKKTKHEHDWKIDVGYEGGVYVYAVCMGKDCHETLSVEEIKEILDTYYK